MQPKRKIINDPVFGFVNIYDEFIYELIQHPYLQRLNRIRQVGMASYVYPGAQHTRFHHTIGAMYLMDVALRNLRDKGHEITKEEYRGALVAILMHDTGHTPFSHVLENTLVTNVRHEDISLLLLQQINDEKKGALNTAIDIFRDDYPKRFLHQLVSGQLDVDRLDYLQRDSFFTGVSEGSIGAARIMKMLDVIDDKLVVESKGIYSIENFLMSRRFMYWQVYLHKTVVSAENLLINILRRAKYLVQKGETVFATPALDSFLKKNFSHKEFLRNNQALSCFALLDDYDIYASVKVWADSSDKILSMLAQKLIKRKLFRIEFQNNPFSQAYIDKIREKAMKQLSLKADECNYFVFSDKTLNSIYSQGSDKIKILLKDGRVIDIIDASDQLDKTILSKTIVKYFLCYPKDI